MTQVTIASQWADAASDISLSEFGRRPEIVGDPGASEKTLVWEPDLTPEQVQVGQRILRLLHSAVRVTPAEWQALEPDIATLRAYRTRSGNPTNAQVVAALDSVIDVLRVIFRD